MRPPEVYRAINAITAELAREGMPKQNFNLQDDYFYRSIDDVINRLAPMLAAHRLCVLPRALDRQASERPSPPNVILCHVALKVAFDLVSVEDGSCHTVESFGEALDESDKATAKAMSAAYKSAMLQAFCIPVVGEDDPDRGKPPVATNHGAAPVQGWDRWSSDIIEIIRCCESTEALDRVRTTHRGLLTALQRERIELYNAVGAECEGRRGQLNSSNAEPKPTGAGAFSASAAPKPDRRTAKAKVPEHA